MSNNKKTPLLASYAEKGVTPVIAKYVAWLTKQTGYEVDPLSVMLGSALRGKFQKSDENQKRLADQAVAAAHERAARDERAQARLSAQLQRVAAKAARHEALMVAEAEQVAPDAPAPAKAAPKPRATRATKAKAATASYRRPDRALLAGQEQL